MSLFESNYDLKFEMKNRFVRSATHEALATKDGRPTEELKELYIKLAKGGVGAIITGFASTQQNGKAPGDTMLMIDRDELIPEYKSLTDEIRKYDCRSILQIAHCGSQTLTKSIGEEKVAPSAIMNKVFRDSVPKELSEIEIEEVISNFVDAVVRAEKAGFDGVQIHGAHGYLLCSFLSNQRNKRNDQWGGSLENRFRIIKEIFIRVRKLLPEYPLFIKLSAFDFQKNGINVEEIRTICKWLEEIGCDSVEISSGVAEDGFSTIRCTKKPVDALIHYMEPFNKVKSKFLKGLLKLLLTGVVKSRAPYENFNIEAIKVVGKDLSIPIMAVGGIRKLSDMEEIVDNGVAQFISMSRPFILEPSLVNKFEEQKQDKARCIDCGYCMAGVDNGSLRCYYGKLV